MYFCDFLHLANMVFNDFYVFFSSFILPVNVFYAFTELRPIQLSDRKTIQLIRTK